MRALLALLAVHTWWNGRLLRRPRSASLGHQVSVLVPARDEAHQVGACLQSLVAQGAHEVLLLDDGSTDGTAAVARSVEGVTVLTGAPPPAGWLGKPFACQQLADAADPRSTVLVFVDADVVLAPGALAATVGLLDDGLDLVSPYPRQLAPGATWLVQPLLQWSWLTFLPLRLAESPRWASMSAANGQLLAVRREVYDRAGGHAAVRTQVVEDIGLLRAVKRVGGRGGVADGTDLATTCMYGGWRALADGYTKSLPTTSPLLPVLLIGLYLAPLLGRHRRSAYLLGVTGRVVSARRTGGPVLASLTHPLSVAAYVALDARARVLARRGALTWKGRPV